jgi:hypothetical protein
MKAIPVASLVLSVAFAASALAAAPNYKVVDRIKVGMVATITRTTIPPPVAY